jgi:serine/threonine-protein kinase
VTAARASESAGAPTVDQVFARRGLPGPGAIGDAAAPPPAEAAGARIGPYKLLQKVGEGGMGAVFLAEQERPIRRRVALTCPHP